MFEEFLEPWLRLRKKEKNLILARGETHYFFIDVNWNLDHEAEQTLQEQGVSDALLKELRLSFLAVPIKQIRGIAAETTYRGGELYLYMTSGKRDRYTFFETCEESQLEIVFPGVERFNPPELKGSHMPGEERWRADRQDKQTYSRLALVNGVLSFGGIFCALAYGVTDHWAFLLASMVVYIAFAVLEIWLPAYFTMVPREKKQKKESAIDLTVGLMVMTGFLAVAWDIDYVFQGKTYLYALGFAVVVSILLLYLAEEFRRNRDSIAIVFMLSILLGAVLAGNINHAFDFSEPEEVHVVPVLKLEESQSRKRSYYCDVELPDGEKLNLSIGRVLYNSLELGDLVRVEINEGLLGIQYTEVFDAD